MKTFLDCIPCFMDQALRAAKEATRDEHQIKKVLNEVALLLPQIPMDQSPPETARIIYSIIAEVTGNPDPYKKVKRRNISEALTYLPMMQKWMAISRHPLLTAAHLAIAGNIIDMGAGASFNLKKDIKIILNKSLTINDITMIEARTIGIESMDNVVKVISSGTKTSGTVLADCNREFLDLFESADLIISKGQGNFEALSNCHRAVYFFLKAKCRVAARSLGVKQGDIVIKRHDHCDSKKSHADHEIPHHEPAGPFPDQGR